MSRRTRVADWVFGQPLGAPRALLMRLLVGGGMLVAGLLVVLYRLPPEQQNVLWSEDGNQFLEGAFRSGYLGNLFTPYAGYMHFVPRTAAQIVAAFVPTTQLGLAMNIAGAAVWSTTACAAFVFTRDRVRLPLRFLLWLLVLLVPIGSMEVATNVSNSHWFLIFALFMVLSARSGPGSARIVFGSALVAAAVMSDPLALAFAPLVVARVIAMPRVRENIVGIAFAAAGVVQVLMALSTERNRGEPQLQPGSQLATYLVRVVWGDLLGPSDATRLYELLGRTSVVLIAGAVVVALAVFIGVRWRRAGLAVLALGASAAFWGVTAVLTWVSIGRQPLGVEVFLGGRYLVVPSLLLATSIVAVVNSWLSAPNARRAPRVLGVVVALAVAALLISPGVVDYRTPENKAGVPELTTSVPGFRPVCEADPSATVAVPEAPAGFTFAVPCARILSG
ncbi:hypothetical protein VD659_01325 [Herbiconiux sp. 11R-BC]|uniref:hypothetical protein n=1 Tax=Herbiconiux sp. 11R-BC TaxID=3111637 RepID=UPI003C011E61